MTNQMDRFVQKCLVQNCSSTTDAPGVSFLDFPTDNREMIRAWNKALGFRANCKHIPDPKVCEKHFLEEEIIRDAISVKLAAPDVVPSVGVVEPGKLVPKEFEERVAGSDAEEPSYCRLCAKMERQPLKQSLEKMMKCSETAKLLNICLESSLEYEMLPRGVCDACCHMMKFLIKFVRTCSGAQGKLVRIFTENQEGTRAKVEEEDTKPETVKADLSAIKREVDETTSDHPVNYLAVALETDEKIEDVICTISDRAMVPEAVNNKGQDVSIKTEPYEMDTSSDFEMPKDFGGFSGSDSHSDSNDDDEDDDNYDEDEDYDYDPEEIQMVKSKKTISIKSEDGVAMTDENPKKKRGRPRKNDPRTTKQGRKPKDKRDKVNDDKPASLCKQICQVCGKILSSSATFNVHMMTHTQQKDIVCPICDRRFYVKQQLKIHIESIHEKKDFVCNICGLKCRWRKSLRRHMLLHNDNPYKHKCTYCDKAFARPNQLRYHVMKHTGDRVYCEICGADYRFNYMLTQHKIRKHGIVVEGVQLYKQSSRKKKTESGEQAANSRRNRTMTGQQPDSHVSQPAEFSVHSSIEPIVQHMAITGHERTNQSESTQVTDLASPATTASFATIGSPEPPPFPVHPQSLATMQHQQQQHHQPSPLSGFNGTTLAMPMPAGGIIGFPSMITRQ